LGKMSVDKAEAVVSRSLFLSPSLFVSFSFR
jgi:hypothetical protein